MLPLFYLTKFLLLIVFVQLLSSRRSPSIYRVTNSKGKVVALCLFKSSYKLGEDIIGTLDFSDAVVPCMQVSFPECDCMGSCVFFLLQKELDLSRSFTTLEIPKVFSGLCSNCISALLL